MEDIQRFKSRRKKLSQYKERSHLRAIVAMSNNAHLAGLADESVLESADANQYYSQRIHEFNSEISQHEIMTLIDSLGDGIDPLDHIFEPAFLSLFDGVMRAFNIGTNQGITASRLYKECKSFSYEGPTTASPILDSYSENLVEREYAKSFAGDAVYSNGSIRRNGVEREMRNGSKMKAAKSAHFNGHHKAVDGFGGEQQIYMSKTHAKSLDKYQQKAETDHAVSCKEICKQLIPNKALTDEDIKNIVNADENLVVTSAKNNRGKFVGKFDKSASQLEKEAVQGYVQNQRGKKTLLTDDERKARRKMVDNMERAQTAINNDTNKKVMKNLVSNKDVQKRMTNDARDAATNQSIGEVIIFVIRPIYFEFKDCMTNGIEMGVNASSFRAAVVKRMQRIKNFALNHAGGMLKDSVFSFFKNFLSMLLEGIVNCLVGVFKNIFRMVKEGLKVLTQIVPILRDKHKSFSEKGDAILKLAAGSLTIFASLGIESWLSSAGIPETFSIIISSILTAILTTLSMYLLDKLELFGVKEEVRLGRIDEILSLKMSETEQEMFSMVNSVR